LIGAPLVGVIISRFLWGYSHFEGELLSCGRFVKKLWMLRMIQEIEGGALVKTIEFS